MEPTTISQRMQKVLDFLRTHGPQRTDTIRAQFYPSQRLDATLRALERRGLVSSGITADLNRIERTWTATD